MKRFVHGVQWWDRHLALNLLSPGGERGCWALNACVPWPPARSMEMEAWASADATSQNSSHRGRRSGQVVPRSLGKAGDRGRRHTARSSQGEAAQGDARTGRLLALSTCHRHASLPSSRFPHSASGSTELSESPFLFSRVTVLCLPPPVGKSEHIATRASGPCACSQAGADQNGPPVRTRAQQVPRCAHAASPIPWP